MVKSPAVSLELARFSSGLRFSSLSRRAIEAARRSLLDSLACGLAGSQTPWARIVSGHLREEGGTREASLWGNSFRGPRTQIAFGNGTMVHSLDFDDYHNSKVHLGAVIIPAVLAMAERRKVTGKELLAAIVAGCETMVRVSLGTGPSSSRLRGWHLTGTCGPFGAAAAAANLLKMDEKTTLHALGIAGTQGAGLWAFNVDGAMTKRIHPGLAARSGILAVLLAGKGFSGPSEILEAEDGGFFRAMSDDFNPSASLRDLDNRFLMEDLALKPYPCCGSIHSAIEGVREIQKETSLKPGEIEEVKVYISRVVQVQCGHPYVPAGVVKAQTNLRYCLAVLLLKGSLGIEDFAEEKLADPQIMEMVRKIHPIPDEGMDQLYPAKFASAVEIRCRGGKNLRARVDDAPGSPDKPLTLPEMKEKVHGLLGGIRDGADIGRLMEQVQNLEGLEEIGPFIHFMR